MPTIQQALGTAPFGYVVKPFRRRETTDQCQHRPAANTSASKV